MIRGRLLGGGVACALFAVSLGATPAFADDQAHFFNNDPVANGWSGGCALTYSLTPEAAGYAPFAEAAYAAISGPTNFRFTRLPDGDSSASIRIRIEAELGGASGMGSTDGTVQLIPLPGWASDPALAYLPASLVAHESMHTLGLDHDNTFTENEMMAPVMADTAFAFGPSDLAGMTILKAQNHCISPGVQDPAYAPTAAKPGTGPSVTVVMATTSKARCKKLHGKWNAPARMCTYLKPAA